MANPPFSSFAPDADTKPESKKPRSTAMALKKTGTITSQTECVRFLHNPKKNVKIRVSRKPER
jgi:hypothetical protein